MVIVLDLLVCQRLRLKLMKKVYFAHSYSSFEYGTNKCNDELVSSFNVDQNDLEL